MVVRLNHVHHHPGLGLQHPMLVPQNHGTRVGAAPQNNLLTQQDGGLHSTQMIGNVMIQVGGTNSVLPQSIALSLQLICTVAYLCVFAVCIQWTACLPRG